MGPQKCRVHRAAALFNQPAAGLSAWAGATRRRDADLAARDGFPQGVDKIAADYKISLVPAARQSTPCRAANIRLQIAAGLIETTNVRVTPPLTSLIK